MRRIYAIGIGGSGAKCLEAVTFLHAIGIFGDSCLNILLVDADYANGNGNRTQINLKNTLECHRFFKPESGVKSQFMAGHFEDFGVWNPLGGVIYSSDLSKIFQQQALTSSAPPLAKLFNALYSPPEQVADLAVGFRGRPPIGSAIMGRLELQTLKSGSGDNWQRLFDQVKRERDAGQEVSIHLFGSIFGGTGASGVPTLATLIAEQLTKNSLRQGVYLNASVLLPYFGFEKPNDGEQKVFAETHLFALNTQAALQHLTEHSNGNFDTVYLMGHENRKSYESHTGGTQQQNEAHFVELYAALAINHGFEQPINKETQAAYISVTSPDRLIWKDLPDSDKVKKLLSTGVRFAYSWYYNFSLELVAAQTLGAKKFAIGAPWFRFFFSLKKEDDSGWPPVGDEEQKKQAETLTKWTKGFLIWAQQIAQSHPKGEQFFRLKEFNLEAEDRNYAEDLSKLIIDFPEKNAKEKARDRLDTFKNKLADQGKKSKGVIGLAHELFSLL